MSWFMIGAFNDGSSFVPLQLEVQETQPHEVRLRIFSDGQLLGQRLIFLQGPEAESLRNLLRDH